jgi:hypothetical protein
VSKLWCALSLAVIFGAAYGGAISEARNFGNAIHAQFRRSIRA